MTDARALVERATRELAEADRLVRQSRYLDAVEAGSAPRESLHAFAGEQWTIVASDRRSFAQLAARFPEPPAGDLFLSLAAGEGVALRHLADFAAALGLDEDALAAHEPEPRATAYCAFVAWLALNGQRADVALAFLANLDAWGANCARLGAALRRRYGLDAEAVAFFDFFAAPPPDFRERALAVIEAGLAAGESPSHALRAARLLQTFELYYWESFGATFVPDDE